MRRFARVIMGGAGLFSRPGAATATARQFFCNEVKHKPFQLEFPAHKNRVEGRLSAETPELLEAVRAELEAHGIATANLAGTTNTMRVFVNNSVLQHIVSRSVERVMQNREELTSGVVAMPGPSN